MQTRLEIEAFSKLIHLYIPIIEDMIDCVKSSVKEENIKRLIKGANFVKKTMDTNKI